MSEKEDDVHRINPGRVHPAVAIAAHMAGQLHAARTSAITAAEFEDLFNSTATPKDWSDHGINLRTAALMVATALHLQVPFDQRAGLSSTASPSDPAAAEASMHAQRTMQTVAAISAFADQFGGGPART